MNGRPWQAKKPCNSLLDSRYIYDHDIYILLGEVNSGIMIAHLLALAAATEHANPPEPTGLHHHFPGRHTMAVLVCGLSSLRTTTPVPYIRL